MAGEPLVSSNRGIRFKKNNENAFVDKYYRVGDLYLTTRSENPSTIFGGTWEKVKTLIGGELIAFGNIISSSGKIIEKDTWKAFSDPEVGDKTPVIENYIEGILNFNSGTFLINPQNLVGMIEVTIAMSGFGSTGTIGLWWGQNKNTLPTGVTFLPNDGNNALLTGPSGDAYGGHIISFIYKVDDGVTENFYCNPMFAPYKGPVTFSQGGVNCFMTIKVYAKKGNTNIWIRTA